MTGAATPAISQTDLIALIANAGWMGKFILGLLAVASVASWAIILSKWRSFKRARTEDREFLETFWGSKNIDEVFAQCEKFAGSPVAGVFKNGVKELRKLTAASDPSQLGPLQDAAIANIQRALGRAQLSESARLESRLGWLATTASASPFVGLFGTVWGIMTSFQGIGATGAANLAVVAPGIAEALIATAFGIGAAIPAVVAYNQFNGRVRAEAVEMEAFQQDFLNIVQRSFIGSQSAARRTPVPPAPTA